MNAKVLPSLATVIASFVSGSASFALANQAEEEIKQIAESAEESGEIENEEGELGSLVEGRFAQVPAFRPQPEADAVRAAAALLAAAYYAQRQVEIEYYEVPRETPRCTSVELTQKKGRPRKRGK